MDGGAEAAEEQQLMKTIEGQIGELGSLKGGADGLYSLFSTTVDGLLKYRDAYKAADGEKTTGWAHSVQTMYGGAAFKGQEVVEVEEFMNQHGGYILKTIGLIDSDSNGDNGSGDGVNKVSQTGGRDPKDNAAFLLEQMSKYVDPRMISLDAAVEFVFQFMDMMNEKTEDLSRQIGIIKLEESTPLGIPLQPLGIPYEIPTRMLVLILQGIFEVLRLVSLFGFPGAGLLRMFGSISGGLLEAAKGDIKSALFTFMGVMGSTSVVIGSFGKIIVKVMSLINNNTRNKLIYAGYESFKSLIIGTAIFIFTTIAPFSIKQMVDANLQKLLENLGKIQTKQTALKSTLEAHPAISGLYSLEFVNFTNLNIDFDSLQRIQDLFIIPEFYCNAAVQKFIEEMKLVPPARIILELMGIPTTDTFIKQSCMNVSEDAKSEAGFERSLLEALKPRLRPLTPAAAQEPLIGKARAAMAGIFGKRDSKQGATNAASGVTAATSLQNLAGSFKSTKPAPEPTAAQEAPVQTQLGQAGQRVAQAATGAASDVEQAAKGVAQAATQAATQVATGVAQAATGVAQAATGALGQTALQLEALGRQSPVRKAATTAKIASQLGLRPPFR